MKTINVKVAFKPEVEWDDALNSAAWVLLEETQKYQEINGHLFNNMKGCLKAAIEKYLECQSEVN